MSTRVSKKRGQEMPRKSGKQQTAQAFYVYCLGERRTITQIFEDALPAPIEVGATLEMVETGELGAVVSRVPLSEYGEDALEERLAEAAWTALRVMRHQKVVEHFASRASVVPLRFATIYLQLAGIKQMLAERSRELHANIERLRGRVEWGLNIYCDRAQLLMSIARLSPRLRELNERANVATPGESYLLKKKGEAMRADEARAEIKRAVAEIERELAAKSVDAASMRLRQGEATEQGELVAKMAFLVERTRFEEFRARAERFAEEHADAGFKLELTGPWPAYNFTTS
jgi:hypothetical protein